MKPSRLRSTRTPGSLTAQWRRAINKSSGPRGSQTTYYLRVEGEGLLPRYKPNEFVLADRSKEVEPGDEVVVLFQDGEILIRVFDGAEVGVARFSDVNERSRHTWRVPLDAITAMHRVTGRFKSLIAFTEADVEEFRRCS